MSYWCFNFSYAVNDPERYGIVELDNGQIVKKITEKPNKPQSNLAITGHYMLTNDSVDIAKELQVSQRGEKEITDLLNFYLMGKMLNHDRFSRGLAWFDCGTHASLLEASSFVETIENRQSTMVACLEEIALLNGWLTEDEINKFVTQNIKRATMEVIYLIYWGA